MSEQEKNFLEIVDLTKSFGSGDTKQEVLRGVSFSVTKGEFCVLLGPSGSGKSTLLNIIGGIDSADSGYISIGGDKLKELGEKRLDILDDTPAVEEVTGKAAVAFTGASVENVSFSYGGEEVLRDVSLTVPEGEIVGITGRSGSGKSTLLKLLMRFWDVQKGSVKVSGVPVREIDTRNLRELESFVTQETHLFHDSIKNNLHLAKLDATDEEIVAACKKASVHDFIMTLPKGYDTPVGELGDTLSGGERQRLGLARAFLHDAPLMLLDEPTSNLDSLNEAVILKSLREEREKKTVVLVSHRASTMRIADRVISAESGRVS